MGNAKQRRERAIRNALGAYGLRVVCLGCGSEGRFWPHDRAEVAGVNGSVVLGLARGRLRETPCPRCQRIALRHRYWVETHPELAREFSLRVRAVRTALD